MPVRYGAEVIIPYPDSDHFPQTVTAIRRTIITPLYPPETGHIVGDINPNFRMGFEAIEGCQFGKIIFRRIEQPERLFLRGRKVIVLPQMTEGEKLNYEVNFPMTIFSKNISF